MQYFSIYSLYQPKFRHLIPINAFHFSARSALA